MRTKNLGLLRSIDVLPGPRSLTMTRRMHVSGDYYSHRQLSRVPVSRLCNPRRFPHLLLRPIMAFEGTDPDVAIADKITAMILENDGPLGTMWGVIRWQ